MKIIVIVHHAGNSGQMSISSAHTKFPNQGPTNAFLMCTNEHYAANLHGHNTQYRPQSCLSNQKTGLAIFTEILVPIGTPFFTKHLHICTPLTSKGDDIQQNPTLKLQSSVSVIILNVND